MRVVEVRTLVVCVERVSERLSIRNGTLGEVWNAVHELSVDLPHAMEMNARADAFRFIMNVNDHHVAFANMQRRARHLEIYAQNPTLDAVSCYTFPVQARC